MFCYLFIFYFHAFTEPLLINIERWFRGKKPFEFSQTIGERLEQERAMWGGGGRRDVKGDFAGCCAWRVKVYGELETLTAAAAVHNQ